MSEFAHETFDDRVKGSNNFMWIFLGTIDYGGNGCANICEEIDHFFVKQTETSGQIGQSGQNELLSFELTLFCFFDNARDSTAALCVYKRFF
jgi:hypothetical protein